MQTEAIAALAASGAAVLGVPAALVVGMRQARAAHRAAELTAHAAHSQARKSARREASVAFVLAAEAAFDECMRMFESRDPIEEYLDPIMKRVLGDVSRACTVIRLEGPEELAQKATTVMHALHALARRGARRQRTAHAWHALKQAAESSDAISAAIGELCEASGPDDPRVSAAWQTIADAGIVTPRLVSPLRGGLRIGGPQPAIKPVGMLEARDQVMKTLKVFIDAVRAHLDEAPVGRT
ncbi:hypothetical protein [Streptomyces tirandamycinicus]|uniref:Uncharacterized protein n=1 Tax=Streptomyces tirandamycinicus TaxID=2174846 RepID=A0A2S1SVH1_9ACTN|nr:hypothetical protein [Streptomyces tirandamycinicus]AWI30403.1 hypothetical protein DDW44_17680 [Streptomyces tirandamycinicus]